MGARLNIKWDRTASLYISKNTIGENFVISYKTGMILEKAGTCNSLFYFSTLPLSFDGI